VKQKRLVSCFLINFSDFLGTHCVYSGLKFLKTGIIWQFQPIETGITFGIWIVHSVRNLFNSELFYLSSIALQKLEPRNGQPGAASAVMEHILNHFFIKSVHDSPKTLNHSIILSIPVINCISLPVIHIDILLPTKQTVNLMRLEDHQQLKRNDLK
jgi:hypothetical protein